MRCTSSIALIALSWACKQEAPPPPPPASPPSKTQSTGPDWQKAFQHTVRYDSTAKAIVVDVKIEPGFHAYTTGESVGRPLQLVLDETSVYQLGEVQYPAGVTKDLPIGKSVIVEGEAKVVGPIERKPGPLADRASGTFKWQVCTDESCDRPRSQTFAVDIPTSN